jgi:hypothetical protein
MERSGQLEQKMLESGIFKLDDKSRPIGIINLDSKKALSTRETNYLSYNLPYKPHFLCVLILYASSIRPFLLPYANILSLILCLSNEIKQYLHNDEEDNYFEKGSIYFEKELVSLLESWGISPNDLKPHYDDFIKKAKKHLQKNLLAVAKPFTRRDSKKTYRRDYLISRLHRIFEEHTNINHTDINHYLTYILIACDIEKGLPQTVFKRIDKAFYKYKKNTVLYSY